MVHRRGHGLAVWFAVPNKSRRGGDSGLDVAFQVLTKMEKLVCEDLSALLPDDRCRLQSRVLCCFD
jgi:hypothetical protein